ncbi:hypothetical protein LguiB_031709 [Lonicera macranthoides]
MGVDGLSPALPATHVNKRTNPVVGTYASFRVEMFQLYSFCTVNMTMLRTEAASSSASRHRYQVFLSFRGKDTRKTFTDHLYTALVQAEIHTFKDEHELERGKNIAYELHKAIGESKIAVIVFSKGYASSEWCLDELVGILERKKAMGLTVIPVFYDVQPSDIRYQRGSFDRDQCDVVCEPNPEPKSKPEPEPDTTQREDADSDGLWLFWLLTWI